VNAAFNQAPVANAGSDVDIVLPVNNVSLAGTGNDPDGTIKSYQWVVLTGPAGYKINSPNNSMSKIENLFQGVYELEFTVVDNLGASAKDTMKITVSSPRLSNFLSNEVRIYPNPVKDIANLSITTTSLNTKLSVSIVNALGMLVKYNEFVTQNNITLYSLDMSNLNEAYYFVTVRFDDGKKMTYKILKTY